MDFNSFLQGKHLFLETKVNKGTVVLQKWVKVMTCV